MRGGVVGRTSIFNYGMQALTFALISNMPG